MTGGGRHAAHRAAVARAGGHAAGHRGRAGELARRIAVLGAILLTLTAALTLFATRQSLVVTARPYLLTRVWIPSAIISANAQERSTTPRPGRAVGIPVLVYHGIQPKGATCNITPETFIAHMSALKRAGYTTLSMDDFFGFMAEGRVFPEKSVLITFDDGRTDSFSGADPVLRRFGFHATMFSILGRTRSTKSFYLTAAETKMMARTGRWDIQSHTANSHEFVRASQMGAAGHALATRAWLRPEGRLESDAEWSARVRRDLMSAKSGLCALTGKPVVALAYPWGDTGAYSADPLIRSDLRALAQAVYPITFRQAGATVDETYNYPSDFGGALRRIYVTYDMTAEELMSRIRRGVPRPLPFAEDAPFASEGWALSSGALQPLPGDGHTLVFPAQKRATRAEVFLDGSRAWADYTVRCAFALKSSETVTVVVRRSGPRDYLAATISRGYVSLQRFEDDAVTTLAEADVDLRTGVPVAVEVSAAGGTAGSDATRGAGVDLTLAVDGARVLRASGIAGAPATGGIAFRIEDERDPGAALALDSLEVTGTWNPSSPDRAGTQKLAGAGAAPAAALTKVAARE